MHCFVFVGMNEVRLHSFMGNCGIDVVESIFPRSEMRRISAEQIKEAIAFEGSTGHEDIIMYFYDYLTELEKYEAGIIVSYSFCKKPVYFLIYLRSLQ